MLWKLRYFIKDCYLKLKYKNLKDTVVYDNIIHEWVDTNKLDNTSCNVEFLMEEYALTGLYYPFSVNGEHDHDHTFKEVLLSAYHNYTTFSLEGYEKYYSEQEMTFVKDILKNRKDKSNA